MNSFASPLPLATPSLTRRNGHHPTTSIKIAYIGGGSRQWALHLIGDLALSKHLGGSLVLHDLDLEAAQHNSLLAADIFSHPDASTSFHVEVEENLEEALRGADFVIISIEPGPTELRHADLEIPAEYGVLQTVGDTTGPGGILRGLRCIPMYRTFARAIAECCPNAWVINYTNPMAICTATLYREFPKIKAFGCCHEVFATQKLLAKWAGQWFSHTPPPREEISLDIAGVNHFTWATGARWRDHDLMPLVREHIAAEDFFADRSEAARTALGRKQWFDHHSLIACDLLRRFGALGAAGDRHLAEFVPWYLRSESEIHRWGVVRTPFSWRMSRMSEPRPSACPTALHPSGEEGVQQIEALLGLRPLVTNVNLPNEGQMQGYTNGPVVETYAEFSHNKVRPIIGARLPDGVRAFVERAIHEQNLTLEAGFLHKPELAFQALLGHPLVSISTEQASEMFESMLSAAAGFLGD